MPDFFSDDDNDMLDAPFDSGDAAEASGNADIPQAEELTPRNNPHLLGHEAAEKQILADFNADRMPHAIIVSGVSGIGKATFAFRLVKFLLSQVDAGPSLFGELQKPESLYLSPDHAVFHRVVSGGHADLMVVEREFDEKKGRYKNDISVDSVRKITPFLRKTAAEGGWRAVIVDSAEYLNRASQNALLKILEEPPEKTVLILTTAQAGAFLPTIRSRCRMINLMPLPDTAVSNLLDRFAPRLGGEEKNALIRLSEGSIGKALMLYQDGGLALYKELVKLIVMLPEMNLPAVHDLADKTGRAGAEKTFDAVRDILTSWCERVARHQARQIPLPDIFAGDAAQFQSVIQRYPAGHFLDVSEKIGRIFHLTENYTLDKRLALLQVFLTLQKPDHPDLVV